MENKKITGAEAFMRSLVHEGVDTIFGYPGGAIMPVFDALFDYDKHLNHILTRHEQGATHAAQGYARVSGKVGVCLVTSGPAATNAITPTSWSVRCHHVRMDTHPRLPGRTWRRDRMARRKRGKPCLRRGNRGGISSSSHSGGDSSPGPPPSSTRSFPI